jgi:type 1 glutamine amidotransferase
MFYIFKPYRVSSRFISAFFPLRPINRANIHRLQYRWYSKFRSSAIFSKLPLNFRKNHMTTNSRPSKGHILLLLGGAHHDFERYAQIMVPVLQAQGYSVTTTYEIEMLNSLSQQQVDIVLMYTCFGNKAPLPPEGPAALDALAEWVASGGRLLAAHGATTTSKFHARFAELTGGNFESHPPQYPFLVIPMGRPHPITQGITAFSVFDEFYIQHYAAEVEILLTAADRGVAYPMAWTKQHGDGSVAYIAIGHSERVWTLYDYQKLLCQALEWLLMPEPASELTTTA